MAVDSFSHPSSDVLNDLDPLSRALLDLSLQRGMEDAEIADVLGTDETAVLEVRIGLLRSLAERLAPEYADAEPSVLQSVVAERLYPTEPVADEPAVEADDFGDEVDEAELHHLPTEEPADDRPTALHAVLDEPEPVAADEPVAPAQPAEERKRRSALVFLLPLLLVATLAALIVALTSGGDDGDSSQPATQQPAPAKPAADKPKAKEPKAQNEPRALRMTAVSGGKASGTAALDGRRLKLKLRGLPSPKGGAYEIWLYDSIIDAKSLGSSKDSKIDLDARLPANAKDYEFVDVSLEPADGNPNHSGRSVLRVPMAKLAR